MLKIKVGFVYKFVVLYGFGENLIEKLITPQEP